MCVRDRVREREGERGWMICKSVCKRGRDKKSVSGGKGMI